MSHPSRPRTHGRPQRRHRFRPDTPLTLEERCLLAPYLPLTPDTATFTAAATPTNTDLGTVTVTPGAAAITSTTTLNTTFVTAAPVTSVSELTPVSSFGGDIVRIAAGPGGVFGNDVYAISRGAGSGTGSQANAVNRPGVIYRVDPATGKASVFFDLNTVINQLEPGGNASNSVGASTGLVNWYDISFDPEGYFDGKPSMFVTSVDRSDPNKNAVYQIGPDGSFLGMFTQFTAGLSSLKFTTNPTSIVVPPPQQQNFLRGIIVGSGISSTNGAFSALYFNANEYSPGQVISSNSLPTGVSETNLTEGPQVGLTAANPDYLSPVYGAFTDFGTPAAGGIPAQPGGSGVQGLNGDLLITPPATATATTILPIDQQSIASTLGRRYQDIAFDQYGYFSQGFTLTATTTTSGGGGNTIDGTGVGISAPINAGSVFVADLASGLSVTATPIAPLPTTAIQIPVQGSGPIGVESNGAGGVVPILTNGNTTGGTNATGGRILRISPTGVVSVFAEGFDTSGAQDSSSFVDSSLSISFSADGTILYASDNDAIWEFKTVTDLASASSGSYIGLNDLRSLGVPYDGLGEAVAIVDTGVDANSTPFRGRVSTGFNVVTNGFGNDDTAPGATTTTGNNTGNNNNTTGAATNISTSSDGHGTLVAGVVAQFVPQATIVPVNIFNPFQATSGFTQSTGTGTGTTGGNNTGNNAAISNTSNAVASNQDVWLGMHYVAQHPFALDPIRPGTTDRVVAATFAFGTNETFASEGDAFHRYPQVVIALKSQLHKFVHLGITPVAAAGELGQPFLASQSSTTGTGGANGGTTGTSGKGGTGGNTNTGNGTFGNDNSDNKTVGDDNGMSLPAILNEVVSATGTIPFPYATGPNQTPNPVPVGVVPRPLGPILVYNGNTIGGTAGSTTTGSGTTTTGGNNLALLTAGNFAIYSGRILASSNRSNTTDFAAPAIDVPTFRRTFVKSTTTTGTTTTDNTDHNVFNQSGTSLSAGITAGAFALVASALNYWSQLAQSNGVTSDAYLTTPPGVNTLNFGKGSILDLSAWNNPNGINGILAWTAVPVQDPNDGLAASTPPNLIGNNNPPNYAEINVANAVAAIEGYEALNYLIAHNDLHYLESNNNGLITAQSIQEFVDNSAKMGLPEAGAMAALLGGTARPPANSATGDLTAALEQPDQPDVKQRRFNFFDYVADGQLNGSVTVSQLEMLAHTLLPTPDAYTITNRARASVNGFLVNPSAQRNFRDLQHILPRFEFAPITLNRKYANNSPASLRVSKNIPPGIVHPIYSLFAAGGTPQSVAQSNNSTTNNSTNSSTSTSSTVSSTTSSNTSTTPSSTTSLTTTVSSNTASNPSQTTTGSQSNNSTTSSQNTLAQQLLDVLNNAAQTNLHTAGTISSSGSSTTGSTSSTTGSTTTTGSSGTVASNMATITSQPTPIDSTGTTTSSTTSDPNSTSTGSSTSSSTGGASSTSGSSSTSSGSSGSGSSSGSGTSSGSNTGSTSGSGSNKNASTTS